MTLLHPETHAELIHRPPTPLNWAVFAGYLGVAALLGLMNQAQLPGHLRPGFLTLVLLAGAVNAALTLGLFPWIFTLISRRIGGVGHESAVPLVRAVTAWSLLPTVLGLLLSALSGTGAFSLVGGLITTVTFVYGFSLANGTDLFTALKHVLLVWGVMVLAVLVLNLGLGLWR